MEYVTVNDAAAELGMAPSAIRRRIATGAMKATRVGARVWLIPRDEVDRWQKLGRQKPGPKKREGGTP